MTLRTSRVLFYFSAIPSSIGFFVTDILRLLFNLSLSNNVSSNNITFSLFHSIIFHRGRRHIQLFIFFSFFQNAEWVMLLLWWLCDVLNCDTKKSTEARKKTVNSPSAKIYHNKIWRLNTQRFRFIFMQNVNISKKRKRYDIKIWFRRNHHNLL